MLFLISRLFTEAWHIGTDVELIYVRTGTAQFRNSWIKNASYVSYSRPASNPRCFNLAKRWYRNFK